MTAVRALPIEMLAPDAKVPSRRSNATNAPFIKFMICFYAIKKASNQPILARP
jgi:hypothetical protein